ncbi:large ribosomal subunit protein uL4-like [Musca autumnalis]|uniref:large ribosomal subunit protein uL4-like n=1 Tax=Musca autumnalis TaxID=221902 RepID=UPI003CF53B86
MAASKKAGHQISVESWDTGSAVACIPSVCDGGIHRSGPVLLVTHAVTVASTKTFRSWNRKQKSCKRPTRLFSSGA